MAALAPEVSGEARHRRAGARLPRPYLVVAAVLPFVLLAVFVVSLAARSGAFVAGARLGAPAPEFSLADLDGNPVRLADLRGRPVIVNFWASWCPPCIEEFPLLQRAATAGAGRGLAIVGIVYNDRSEAARAFMQRMGASWPAVMDPGGEVARAYGIYGPPETFFIDRNGFVVGHQIGQLSATELDRQLTALLAKE